MLCCFYFFTCDDVKPIIFQGTSSGITKIHWYAKSRGFAVSSFPCNSSSLLYEHVIVIIYVYSIRRKERPGVLRNWRQEGC